MSFNRKVDKLVKRKGKRSKKTKRGETSNSKFNFDQPKKPTFTSRDDVVDYLSEDDDIVGQRFVNISFVEPENDEQRDELLRQVCEKTRQPIEIVREVVEEWFELEHPLRAVKIRGASRSYEDGCEKAAITRERHGQNFHIFTAEMGKWLPFNPNPEKLADENYYEEEMNKMLKSYKVNRKKTDMFYEKRKKEMMEKASKDEGDARKDLRAERVDLIRGEPQGPV